MPLQVARDMDPRALGGEISGYVRQFTTQWIGGDRAQGRAELLACGYEAGLIPHRVPVEFVR